MIAEPCECCGEIENIRLQGETYLCALEAEIERLRAELAEYRHDSYRCAHLTRADKAEAAIARVRNEVRWARQTLSYATLADRIDRALDGAE